MLVKKVNPDWMPSENPGIKVGETIEITNPRQLVLDGTVVAVGEHGEEQSPYELYGVLVDAELEEFKEFAKMKQANALKKRLESEQEDLQKLSAELDKKEAMVTPAAPAPAPVAAPATVEPVAPATSEPVRYTDATAWSELVKAGNARGIYKVGMNKKELVAALN